MLWQLQEDSKGSQPYIYIYMHISILPQTPLSSSIFNKKYLSTTALARPRDTESFSTHYTGQSQADLVGKIYFPSRSTVIINHETEQLLQLTRAKHS